MSTYYVRKTGSDANAGTSAGAAWLTIGKAILAGGIASGDTVYIGAGIYRESLTVGITPSATTSIIGDVDGTKTGDAGEVRWTAYTTDDKSAAGTFTCKLNGKNFLSFSNIHFVGGTNASNGSCIDGATVASSHDITFTKCAFTNGSSLSATLAVSLTGPVDAVSNYTFDSCWWGPCGTTNGQVLFTLPTSTTADYTSAIVVKNNVFIGGGAGGGVDSAHSGANSFKAGGIVVQNCFALNCTFKARGASLSTVFPMLVYGNVMVAPGGVAQLFAAASGQLVEDYNLIMANSPRTSVSVGPFSQTSGNYSQLFSYGQEVIWGGQLRSPGTPLAGSPWLGFGNAALAAGRAPTCADDATVGTIAWTNPTNATAPDGSNATCVLTLNASGHYLKATGFNFAIPAGATISSVRAELIGLSATTGAVTSCNSVKLVKGGTIGGNDLASSNTSLFTTGASMYSWGNTADPLWGNTLTVSDVNASNFGVAWSPKTTTADTCTLDYIRLIVAYTLSDGSGGVAVDAVGRPRPAGGNSTSYAAGALERGDTATVQSGTARSGSAWKITGPGHQDFRSNVDASSVTLGVWARYDTASQQPTVTVLAAPELGLAADTVLTWSDPGTNTWGQFTTTIVPTAAGVVRVRCATAAGTGIAYFDDVSFT